MSKKLTYQTENFARALLELYVKSKEAKEREYDQKWTFLFPDLIMEIVVFLLRVTKWFLCKVTFKRPLVTQYFANNTKTRLKTFLIT